MGKLLTKTCDPYIVGMRSFKDAVLCTGLAVLACLVILSLGLGCMFLVVKLVIHFHWV